MIRRYLASVTSVFRVVPASAVLVAGTASAAFITLFAGPAWAPAGALLSWYCIGYGAWRSCRRYRSLHRFTPWTPPRRAGR